MSISKIKKRLRQYAVKDKAPLLMRYFKTGPGEYAEGDMFIGTMVPFIRKVAREFKDAPLKEIQELLRSRIHEERLAALLILIYKFRSADKINRKKIYQLYLKNAGYINNWDLVDLSAPHIIGGYLDAADRSMLYELAVSNNLWKRRMAIIATLPYIKNDDFKDTIKISMILNSDKEDLIHKAVGWMLREIGKRNVRILEQYLSANSKTMPRTMLRYAIEKFPESKRRRYLLARPS
jgi:3-methyladenine DNA glycosylase AlkD